MSAFSVTNGDLASLDGALSRRDGEDWCRGGISLSALLLQTADITSPFVASGDADGRRRVRRAGLTNECGHPSFGSVYLRVSAACLPNFFKRRSNVSRSFFERTAATFSIAAACSPNPRVISARPFAVSSTRRTRRSSG